MPKKVIAVDIDDVLAANAEAMIAFSNERWGTHLTLQDYDEHWGVMWQLEHDIETTENRAHEFFDSGEFGRFRHFQEAKPVLQDLKRRFKLIVVTSRRIRLMSETTDWIDGYFPDLFDKIHYAGIWDKPKEHRHMATKAGLCEELGADYLIDDQTKHCVAAAKLGIESLLFGSYKWNQMDRLPQKVIRIADWNAVKEFFDGAKS